MEVPLDGDDPDYDRDYLPPANIQLVDDAGSSPIRRSLRKRREPRTEHERRQTELENGLVVGQSASAGYVRSREAEAAEKAAKAASEAIIAERETQGGESGSRGHKEKQSELQTRWVVPTAGPGLSESELAEARESGGTAVRTEADGEAGADKDKEAEGEGDGAEAASRAASASDPGRGVMGASSGSTSGPSAEAGKGKEVIDLQSESLEPQAEAVQDSRSARTPLPGSAPGSTATAPDAPGASGSSKPPSPQVTHAGTEPPDSAMVRVFKSFLSQIQNPE